MANISKCFKHLNNTYAATTLKKQSKLLMDMDKSLSIEDAYIQAAEHTRDVWIRHAKAILDETITAYEARNKVGVHEASLSKVEPKFIGVNSDNEPLYEDADGKRYIDRGMLKEYESIAIVPTREGIKTVINARKDSFKTQDELVSEAPEKPTVEVSESQRFELAKALKALLDKNGEITLKNLLAEGDKAFGGSQATGAYSGKDAYDAMEVAVNLYLLDKESPDVLDSNAPRAANKAKELNYLIQALPTQTKRDAEMDEYQQFSTPPALSFVANWVANVQANDSMLEPSAGTGDLAIWPKIAGAKIILNELSKRRIELLHELFPDAQVFNENAEQLNNVLPKNVKPSVIVMNPPFSATAGRVQGSRETMNGAKHIEQALLRLDNGGRLVAIVGQGMAAGRPAFSKWWNGIGEKYNVRANIGISGKEYAKYGTTFDNQILVIDKTGPTTEAVMSGNVESVSELPKLLEGIKNDRQLPEIQRAPVERSGGKGAKGEQNNIQQEGGTGGASGDQGGVGQGGTRDGGVAGTGTANISGESKTAKGDELVNENRPVGTNEAVVGGLEQRPSGSGLGDIGTVGNEPERRETYLAENKQQVKEAFTDSIYAEYTPQRLSVPGAKQHPGKLVQSAAMAAVEPPSPTYQPHLSREVIDKGLLSIAQIEAVVYAGQAHSQIMPNEQRKGFFIGDGTGVGKGREISGIILDNMAQGRKKAIWVSFNEGLLADAKRDFAGVGGDPSKLFFQGKTKPANAIIQKDGVMFTSYSTMSNGQKQTANDLGQTAGKTRLQQIVDWVGPDFDGVIAFDESHSLGNAIAIKGKRGVKKAAKQALAGIALQEQLPKARIVYVSATGATEISNLGYAQRLGLWGEGTAFANVIDFINKVNDGGVAAMELLSRDMKALGMYIARSLSYDGVTYERLVHELSPLQKDIYNELATAWQLVLQNVNEALEITNAGSNGNAKSSAMSAFWGSHQRFFNQIITAMQTPAVIDDIHKQLNAGNVAVIQIVNTNEASQERNIAESIAKGEELEELDFTPRQMLTDYIRNGFPVVAYEDYSDENGNTAYRPVQDANGNLVFDMEAIIKRDKLLETLQQIRVPESPLDSIIAEFGTDIVAEVTGRSRRFVQTRDAHGNLKVVEEKRNKGSARSDADAFQNDKKKILVFSGAGGTGYSFHADNTAVNKKRRIHYVLQPGWRASSAVQGFGRTHRTNQANAPHYVLPTTDLKAQKRFISSIARVLDQLGALTKGQRQTGGQGMFEATDNLESEYATTALYNLFTDLHRGATPLSFKEVTSQMGLNLKDSDGSFTVSKIPPINQFLNRLLSLTTDMQDKVFEQFENRLIEAVEYAKQNGTFDTGVQTLSAKGIVKTRDDVAFEDAKSGAQTRYIELAVTNDIAYLKWDEIAKDAKRYKDKAKFYVWERGVNTGKVFMLRELGERTNSKGETHLRSVIQGIRENRSQYRDDTYEIKQGYKWGHLEGRYQKITISHEVTLPEAKQLWEDQIANAPEEETITNRMLVGVILPIWDRIHGNTKIYRLQTDSGEQLLGMLLTESAAKDTLKNLGMDSSLSKMPVEDQFKAIRDGGKAILSNGWEISKSVVNYEPRIEIKGRLSSADTALLVKQGAFVERIQWQARVFIPFDKEDITVFKRIVENKPIVEMFGKDGGEVKYSKKIIRDTIEIDGVQRPTTNSNGQPIAQTEEGIRNFWKWFGDSKVIDDKGRPLVVYHGTKHDVSAFNTNQRSIMRAQDAEGFYFTKDREYAESYATRNEGANLIPAYLSFKNSKNLAKDTYEHYIVSPYALAAIRKEGFDSLNFNDGEEYVAFNPNQIKSAIGNMGAFSTQSNDIRFSNLNKPIGQTHTQESIVTALRDTLDKAYGSGWFDRLQSTGKFKIIDSRGASDLAPNGATAQAFYNPTDATTYFVHDNIALSDDLKQLVLHEVGVHALQLGKTSSEFQDILAQLDKLKDSNAAVRAAYGAIPKDTPQEHRLEELAAYLVQHKPDLAIVNRIIAWFRNALRAIGKLMKPFNQVKFIQWANKLNEDDILFMANAALKNVTQRVGSSEGMPLYSRVTDATEGIRRWFNGSTGNQSNGGNLGLSEESRTETIARLFQDGFNRMQTLQKQLNVAEASDVYLAEERYSGITAAKLDDFKKDAFKPLVEAMVKDNISLGQLDKYVMARHAKERNAYIASINPKMPDGGSGLSNADADQILRDFDTEGLTPKLEELAKRVYKINDDALNTLGQAGLIDAETYTTLHDQYNYYVPLKGKEGVDDRGGTGMGYSVSGSGIKSALGRGEGNLAESPVAHSLAQAEAAIIRSEKAKIGQALVNLMKENPDPEFWTITQSTYKKFLSLDGDWFEGFDTLPEDLIENVDYHRTKAITAEERSKAKAEGRKPVAQVVYRIDPSYRYRDDVFSVMMDGKLFRITIKDKILAEQLKKLNVNQLNAVILTMGSVNRFLAMVNTALNPEFVITNFERDLATASINLSGEHSVAMAKKLVKNTPAAIKGIFQENFNLAGASTNSWSKLYQELKHEGGTVGFFGLEDIETKVKKIQDQLTPDTTYLGKTKKTLALVQEIILDANQAVENGARLSAYKAALDAEMTKAQAASLAKNLTVNFNRRGELAPIINSAYLFANASIQGTARLFTALKYPKVRKIVAGIAMGGFALALYNHGAGGDDDDGVSKWEKLPDYLKQTNIIIMNPDGSGDFFKIKMPYGYNVFWYAGVALHDLIFGKRTTVMQQAGRVATALVNAFNPLGGADLLDTLTPTVLKPIEQSTRNINFMMTPIKPENPFDRYDRPESDKAFSSTNEELKDFAHWLNEATGGSRTTKGIIDISPETIKHYVNWVTGGAGMTVYRSADITSKAFSGQPIEQRDIPFIRTLGGKVDEQYDTRTFYDTVKKVEAAKEQAEIYKEERDPRLKDFYIKNRKVIGLSKVTHNYKKRIDALRKQKNIAAKQGDFEKVKTAKKLMATIMRQYSHLYEGAANESK